MMMITTDFVKVRVQCVKSIVLLPFSGTYDTVVSLGESLLNFNLHVSPDSVLDVIYLECRIFGQCV